VTSGTARCACGALTVSPAGDPIRISVCHCLDCKRRTGTAFSWNAHWPKDQVAVEGNHVSYSRSSDAGYLGEAPLLCDCGATVFYEVEQRPGIVSIPVGAFADPSFPAPRLEVYEERRCPWLPRLATVQE
jgi:hypothetical protein